MIKKFSAVFFAFAIGNFAFSQDAEVVAKTDNSTDLGKVSVTLEQAVEYALKNNRTLKSSDIDLEIQKRAADNAWNVLLPDVSLSGTMSRTNEYNPSNAAMASIGNTIAQLHQLPTTSPKTDFDSEKERWHTVGTLSAKWTFSFAYIGQIKATKVAYENGKITFEQSQKEMILNIKKLFYGLLLQQENLKIKKATLENARQRMVQAQTSYKNGAIPELALLQTQVSYQNTRPEVETAEQELNQTLDTFAFLLGMPVGTIIELSGTIEPKYVDVNAKSLIETYGMNDLSIQSLEGNIKAIKIGLDALNLSVWAPAIVVNYGWQPAYLGDNAFAFPKDLGKNDSWYDSGNLSLTFAWNLTNMLPWSSTQQKIADNKQQLAKLELTLETLRENQKVSVRKSVDTLNQARAQIDSMRRNVTLAQRAYDATYRQYRNGMTELLNLRDAETSLNQAKLGLLNQKFQYVSALMDLENTLNTTLVEE